MLLEFLCIPVQLPFPLTIAKLKPSIHSNLPPSYLYSPAENVASYSRQNRSSITWKFPQNSTIIPIRTYSFLFFLPQNRQNFPSCLRIVNCLEFYIPTISPTMQDLWPSGVSLLPQQPLPPCFLSKSSHVPVTTLFFSSLHNQSSLKRGLHVYSHFLTFHSLFNSLESSIHLH